MAHRVTGDRRFQLHGAGDSRNQLLNVILHPDGRMEWQSIEHFAGTTGGYTTTNVETPVLDSDSQKETT